MSYSVYSVKYLLARITTVEKHTRVQFRRNHAFKCQLWLLGEKHNHAKIVPKYTCQQEENWTYTYNYTLSFFAKDMVWASMSRMQVTVSPCVKEGSVRISSPPWYRLPLYAR